MSIIYLIIVLSTTFSMLLDYKSPRQRIDEMDRSTSTVKSDRWIKAHPEARK
jgi:hypothetical protein